MNILLSLNYKFFEIESSRIFQILEQKDNFKMIDGFEINIKSHNDAIYLKDFIKECKEKNYILNLHSPTFNNFEEYHNYFDVINDITKLYNQDINVVFHSIVMGNVQESIEETIKYLNNIYNYLDSKKYKNIILSIENLNNINGLVRLKKEEFKEIFKKFKNLKFTYDIGHELIDESSCINKKIPKYLFDRLNNVHVHTFNGRDDHYPILSNDGKEKMIFDTFKKLELLGYSGNVVAEYALDYMEGFCLEERFEDYIDKTIWLKKEISKDND